MDPSLLLLCLAHIVNVAAMTRQIVRLSMDILIVGTLVLLVAVSVVQLKEVVGSQEMGSLTMKNAIIEMMFMPPLQLFQAIWILFQVMIV